MSCHTRLGSPCACKMLCIRPPVQPKGQLAPRMTRSCISASFTATALPPAWRISVPPHLGQHLSAFSVSSTADGAINFASTGSGLCFMVRDGLQSTRDSGERLMLIAYPAEVTHLSPEDPCKVFLPSEFSFLVSSGQGAVLLVDWYGDSILRPSC